jgi:hypothetical protein
MLWNNQYRRACSQNWRLVCDQFKEVKKAKDILHVNFGKLEMLAYPRVVRYNVFISQIL